MNFENMWSVKHNHTDIMYVSASHIHFRGSMNLLFPSFWIIAIPVMSIITPTFMWPDIARAYHRIKKRSLAGRITKVRPNELFILSDVPTRANRPPRGLKASEMAIFMATLRLSQTV